jgi:signal transduction histidine kinase
MTREKRELLDRTFQAFMDIGFGQQNLHLLDEIVAKDVVGFGTAIDERLFGIRQLQELLTRQKEQSAGLEMKWEVKTLDLHISADENTAVFTNEVTLDIPTDREPIRMYLRFSVVLEFEQHKWVVVHWHGSKPEQVESEKDTWGLDLWKAKADELEKLVAERTAELLVKNRDLEIEAALEKVRTRTMAMFKSEELNDVVSVLFEKLKELQIPATAIGIAIYIDGSKDLNAYVCGENEAGLVVTDYRLPFFDHKIPQDFNTVREKQLDLFEGHYSKEEKNSFYEYLFENTSELKHLPDDLKRMIFESPSYTITMVGVNHATFNINDFEGKILSEGEVDIVRRFARVFDQTYTRFLDLQKAEAQTREAQIEAALEKVRSRSLAMHKADELLQVATVMRAEMAALGVEELETSSIYTMLDQETAECWYAIKDVRGQNSTLVFDEMTIDLKATHVGREMLNFFEGNSPQTSILMKGEQRKEWINYCASRSNVLEGYYGQEIPERTYHLVKFSHGYVGAATPGAISTESWSLLQRITGVFSMAYTRFLDLQKAEAQAREAQIEAALERVRSRSMAMHKSEELREVIQLVFEQFRLLNFTIDSAQFDPDYKASDDLNLWTAVPGQPYSTYQHIPYFDNPIFNSIKEAKEKKLSFQEQEFSLEKKNEFFRHFFKHITYVPEERQKFILESPGFYRAVVFLDNISLAIQNYSNIPYTNEEIAVLKRFGKTFEQVYTRFLDLQKAEAQAREAQIEASLERVRSTSLAMHSSQDLSNVVFVVFTELVKLDAQLDRCLILTVNPETLGITWYLTGKEGLLSKNGFLVEDNPHPSHQAYLEGWRTKRKNWHYLLAGEEKKSCDHYLFSQTELSQLPEFIKADMAAVESIHLTISSDDFGCLIASSISRLSQAHAEIVDRFTTVFNQTYTRFLDLQKAEAQAREAQIEAALERVRSKTMAMHNSEEVGETVATLFDELVKLGVNTNRCGILICSESKTHAEVWTAKSNPDRNATLIIGQLALDLHPLGEGFYRSWKKKEEVFTYTLKGDDMVSYYKAINNSKYYPTNFNLTKLPEQEVHTDFNFEDGAIFSFSKTPIDDEAASIFKRFAKVFGQTYRRYLDLQKAESQAREAQIEAALERVRSKAMAMHNSSDLPSTAIIAFSELKKLGFVPIRGGISIQNKEDRKNLLYSATSSDEADNLSVVGWATLDNHPILSEIYNQWILGNDYYPSMKGKVLQAYYKQIQPTFNIPLQFPDEEQFGYFMHFTHGTFYGWCKQPVTEEEKKLLKRFSAVVDLTFKRFFDLQKAEKQAREAQIEAALEKVRSRTMAMQSSEELADAAYVLFEQLKALGVTHERINIGIVNEDNQTIDFWITEQGGDKLNTKFSGRISEPTTLSKAYAAWKNGEKSLMVDLQGEELKSWLFYLNNEIKIPFNKSFLHDRRVQTAGFFSKGMLILTSPEPLQQEALYLLEKFAGVFDLTYTRFSDLKLAEAQALQAEKDLVEIKIARQKAEDALAELKATQAQLIQSEKMASLGELTAGIAHEIQNPLNFVNNFSEVSAELVEEMNEELEKGDLEEVKYIASELKENLNKINHHGKRAGSIVKGMLEHSRKSEGKKELTDLNQLADECLRLSFHGLRAKDKTFQADFKTDFDPNLPKLEVVSQDIGRVLLNLINNAFYAVGERAKMHEADYKPIVTVSSAYSPLAGGQGGSIEISVQDNGSGIPEAIKDKIFQPFFTTKPTGSGTGLGLSLSYDIVKAHGGELKVVTEEGEGSEFIIQLSF